MMNKLAASDDPNNRLSPDCEANTIEKAQTIKSTSSLMQTLHETAMDFASIDLIDVQTMHEFDVLCLAPVKIR
jgi:hypothetical protein